VASHHGADRCRVGKAAAGGGENIRHLLEIGGPEHPGCRDREEPHILLASILEPVDLSAADANRLAGPLSPVSPSIVQVQVPSRT
jgi:hypothetical protein